MPDPQTPTAVAAIRGVELVKTGTWNASTGVSTITREQLASIVAAYGDKVVDHAVIKLGHTDPRFDGEPAAGWVENLRLTDNGDTLVGDLVGMPAKLAEIVPTAYRRRSVEIAYGVKTAAGKVYGAVLTGLALLGISKPAVKGLADVLANYTGPELDFESTGTVELSDQTISTDTTPVPHDTGDPPKPEHETKPGQTGTANHQEVAVMGELNRLLGLADDADEAAQLAAITALQTGKTEADTKVTDLTGQVTTLSATPPATTEFKVPDGFKLMTDVQFSETQSVVETYTKERRDQIVADAAKAGKIGPTEVAKFRTALDENEANTVSLLAALAPQRVPTVEIGSDATAQFSTDEATKVYLDDFEKNFLGLEIPA